MSERVLQARRIRKQIITLSHEERVQLNVILDLLIPSDEEFPPPSSLHLLDELLRCLVPGNTSKTTLELKEKRLRTMLHDLNVEAGGNFCHSSPEVQQTILKHWERREPAFFQELWTLINHSYYTHLATTRHIVGVS